ncbi:MAG TPA: sensor N-terminal transmembrane domain-containing protein, partial [Allosphingosinicella sp.]
MPRSEDKELDLRWSGRWMLLHRILAVNIFAVAVLAGSIFYLDGFRRRLTETAAMTAEMQARNVATALAFTAP